MKTRELKANEKAFIQDLHNLGWTGVALATENYLLGNVRSIAVELDKRPKFLGLAKVRGVQELLLLK